MDSESQVSSSVFTIDETLPYNLPLSPTGCSGSQNIRRILLLHLNLIQEQQERILSQERELVTLQQEKSLLQSKLQRIERRLSKFTSESQKEVLSGSSASISNSIKSANCLTLKPQGLKRISRKKLSASSDLELRTLIPYLSHSITNHSSIMSNSNLNPQSNMSESQLELPSFMTYSLSPSLANSNYSSENLNDATFLKRHKKLEECEKRRKRWDIQRFREQHKNDSQKKNSNGLFCEKSNPCLYLNSNSSTLFSSNPTQLERIEVADTVPIFAFGRPLPAILPKPFELNFN